MDFAKFGIAAAFAVGAAFGLTGAANATTFVFKGNGNDVLPLGAEGIDYTRNCGTVGTDYCSIDDTAGLNYERDGIGLNVKAYAEGAPTRLIQDIYPGDSGLGAFSENNASDDQTQAGSNEAIEFIFDRFVTLTNMEFNAGGDTNCSSFGAEGPCGDFALTIDNIFIGNFAAQDLIANIGSGTSFLIQALTQGGGFAVGQFNVALREMPTPAALPLLLAGLAGLGFAARRKREPYTIR